MRKDPLVKGILKLLNTEHNPKNYDLLFTILYNFIPAFIFAPYLMFIGHTHDLVLILVMGIVLFLVDLMHFVKALKTIYK